MSDPLPHDVLRRVSELEHRVSQLEHGKHGNHVKGWVAAGRVLGVSATTVRARFRTDPKFPKPSNVRTFTRRGDINMVPEWHVEDLVMYRR